MLLADEEADEPLVSTSVEERRVGNLGPQLYMLYGEGKSGSSRGRAGKASRREGFFKVGTREFGIGLQSGTRETPNVVRIEA